MPGSLSHLSPLDPKQLNSPLECRDQVKVIEVGLLALQYKLRAETGLAVEACGLRLVSFATTPLTATQTPPPDRPRQACCDKY